MKITAFLLAVSACFAADRIPDSQRAEYWKLRAEIAEANAAFAGSLTAEQKRMLEAVRAKSIELQSVRETMEKSCKRPMADQSGEPICAPEKPTK